MKTSAVAFYLAFLTLLPSLLIADDITTTWGKTYYDAEYVPNRSDLHNAFIRHKNGMIKISYTEMTDSDKLKYGYNPEKAKEEAESKKKAIALEQQKKQEQKEADAQAKKTAQDLKDLEIISKRFEEDRPRREAEALKKAKEAEEEQKRQEEAKVIEIEKTNSVYLIDGVAYNCYPYFEAVRNFDKTVSYENVQTRLLNLHRFGIRTIRGKIIQVTNEGLLVNWQSDRNILLKDYEGQDSVVDGQEICVLAKYKGRSQYISVLGANTTVGLYVCLNKPNRPIPESEIRLLKPCD